MHSIARYATKLVAEPKSYARHQTRYDAAVGKLFRRVHPLSKGRKKEGGWRERTTLTRCCGNTGIATAACAPCLLVLKRETISRTHLTALNRFNIFPSFFSWV